MKQLRIKDNTRTRQESFSEIAGLTGIIADKTLEELEREGVFVFPELAGGAEDLTKEQLILQRVNDFYLSGNVMGFLGCGDERLVISSRFSSGDDDFFLQYLLGRVLDFPNLAELGTDANHDNRLFNLLLFLFPHYLQSTMRKGLYKTYIRSRHNDENVKGTIDIARHIAKNTPFLGNVAYSQREYSYDNQLMELVRHTIEYIRKKPYGNNLLRTVKDETKLVVEATPAYEYCDRRKIVSDNKQNPVKHAYYREYRALQHLCILILQHEKHQIGSGTRQIYGILFDGAWLWEEYVNLLIKDRFYHPMNKSGRDGQWLFSGGTGLIYPDFISRNRQARVIADAKYKPEEHIGNRDYLQVLAYMLRFDAGEGLYLYPESALAEDRTLVLNRGSTYEKDVAPRSGVRVTKHGLRIPQEADHYEDFAAKMKAAEKAFTAAITVGAAENADAGTEGLQNGDTVRES